MTFIEIILKNKKEKTNVNNILNIIILIIFLIVGITGIIIFPNFLKIFGININNLPKVEIYKYHHWLGLILFIITSIHIDRYWKLLLNSIKKFFIEIKNLKKNKFHKKNMIYIINLLLIISYILVFFTGIIKFPGFLSFIGMSQLYIQLNLISFIHDYSGFFVVILTIMHISLYLKRFLITTKKNIKLIYLISKKNKMKITVFILIICIFFIIFIYLNNENSYHIDLFNNSENEIIIEDIGVFSFNPNNISSLRKDIFQNKHFSVFDILIHLDSYGFIDLEYHFDGSMNTHIIDSINDKENWWYIVYYDGGWSENNVFRMDHYPYKEKMNIRIIREDSLKLVRVYNTFKDEIKRKSENNGRIIIPSVEIRGPSTNLIFNNVEVKPHNLRNDTFQNSKVRFLINDLLRENVEVFWSLDSFFANCKSLSEKNLLREFPKGSFAIPFEGNISKDKLITSIIIDYNISSEIDDNTLNIEAFVLTEKIEMNTLQLIEPKIAQHFDIPIRYGWPCYLQIAESGGFLNFDFLLENEVLTELNRDKYNVFMWPYEPAPARLYEVVISLSNKREFETIRSFVKEGGGYIGSCYGALAASSGFLNPLSGLHLIQAYNPLIPFLPFSFTLSISDSLMMERAEVLEDLYTSYSIIDNNTHPITFSIGETVKEFFSGPWYIWLGKNTESISTFKNIILDENKSIPQFIERRVENSPSWTVSSFGNGNMVLFTSHPEFINNITFLFENRNWVSDQYYGRRVIFNSIMYVTAKKFGKLNFDIKYTFSFINELKNNTIGVNITESPFDNFKEFTNKLDEYENNLIKLRNQSLIHMNLYSTYFNESYLYPTKSRPLLYTYTFCDILLDYINKTENVLDKINNIYYKFNVSNYDISNNIISLKNNISEKMNETFTIFQKSLDISNNISFLFNEIENKLISKTLIIENSRKMITTFEISLKYFPQIYFESLKMLNHEWYNYESKL